MTTLTYVNKAGQRVSVYHRNASSMTWEHPYEAKATCGACQGNSTAAPVEVTA